LLATEGMGMVAEEATTTTGVAGDLTTRGTTGEEDMAEEGDRVWAREGLEEVITMEEDSVEDTTEAGEVMEDRMVEDMVRAEVMEDREDSVTGDTTETRGKEDEEAWVEVTGWAREEEDMPLP